jgi:8-oxo-dGTP pyrophosphatase MutT (NUDIX family)
MYNLWQVAGGKVEGGESSLQAVLRETKEETGLIITKEECNYLTNDPEYNCNVYITRVADYQELQRTEADKHGPWISTELNQYKLMAN